jgi:putative transcriptional regulator
MSIKINLDQVLEDRHMQWVDLAKAIGITKANLSILKTGKVKAIRFSTLERICEVLNCQPGDLLSFEPKD